MRRLTLVLALIALAVPSATAGADTSQPVTPTTPGCHHGAAMNAGQDV